MMNNAQLATASLDDIVFDGRNRTYGAYVLRHLYQRHVTRALGIALALLALLVGGQALARLLSPKLVVPVYVPKGPINPIAPPLMPDPVMVRPPAEPVAAQPKTVAIKSVKFDNFKIVREDQPADVVPEQDQLANAHVANVTVKEGIDESAITELRPAATETVVGDEMDGKPFTVVEQMPQLPGGGGTEAIVAAIQKAARYPTQAMAAGVEGKVFASFVVNAQGEVTDLKIVKGLGSGLDEETLRAISKLPRFIPGRQNGRAVSVQYTVPISFRMDK